MGGNETVKTNARVIAATNQDLEELAANGRFRRDLYYRLKVYAIQLPALRERLEDLPLLVDHFVGLYNREVGKHVRAASDEALRLLRDYPWPGNVRELQGAIKYALVNATDEVLTPDCLPASIRRAAIAWEIAAATDGQGSVAALVRRRLAAGQLDVYHKVLLAVDRAVLEEVLQHVHGSQVEAARRLGISRTTLRAKLQALRQAPGESPSSTSPGEASCG